MSTEHPASGQPVGQLSPDGHWRWDGHNWVPVQPAQHAQQPQAQHYAAPQYTQPQPGHPAYNPTQYNATQYTPTQYDQMQYGGAMPSGGVPTKQGLPTWAKVLITLLVLFVAFIALLTVVGLTVDEDYADWSCQDVATEAVRISEEKDAALVLTAVSGLEIVEDNRESLVQPDSGEAVALSCEGTGTWNDMPDTPVLVELTVDSNGDEWVGYEMVG